MGAATAKVAAIAAASKFGSLVEPGCEPALGFDRSNKFPGSGHSNQHEPPTADPHCG